MVHGVESRGSLESRFPDSIYSSLKLTGPSRNTPRIPLQSVNRGTGFALKKNSLLGFRSVLIEGLIKGRRRLCSVCLLGLQFLKEILKISTSCKDRRRKEIEWDSQRKLSRCGNN